MAEVLYFDRPISGGSVEQVCGIERSELYNPALSGARMLVPNAPYLVGAKPNVGERQIHQLLKPVGVSRKIGSHIGAMGGDNTLALAEFSQHFRDYNMGLTGAATSVYAGRMNDFGQAVQRYQDALLEYRDASRHGKGNKKLAQLKVTRYFDAMQKGFQVELAAINTRTRRRGTPLSSSVRGRNIARSSRRVTKLDLTTRLQAENLVNYTKYAKALGNGLVVLDVGSRIGNISNEYQADGDWERELFIESSSFALSAWAGGIVVSAGLTLLIAATPVGWVGIIVVAAAGSMLTNYLVKENADGIYDKTMKWINSL